MAKNSKDQTSGNNSVAAKQPRSLQAVTNGIKTGHDFANLMSALMSDLIEGRITPAIGNATCNAGGKLLKVVEMQHRYGTQGSGNNGRTLGLTAERSKHDGSFDL